ncbi:DUF4082 domain-containing protein [uncultured Friedmanniella sp.]|uniref:DUF4082 domain-containing protein n=1 Tax=uncultured Friedmanniella sp. TaxID=335381 RepID=UPI0035CC08A3
MALVVIGAITVLPAQRAEAACSGNVIVCENQLPGTPASTWDIDDEGDQSIQGFSTKMSVNAGSRVDFKIDTDARAYRIEIYRLGYYQGNGARLVANVTPSATLPQTQPACATDAATEVYDCGTWAVSASWDVPGAAVSGVYIARLIRTDTGGDSHIPFVVRNDGNTSSVLFQTSDTTWQAYNNYGGSDFYHGKANGRAFKLSYNRPFSTRGTVNGRDFLFSNEFPTIRFLEQNGYDVSYVSGLDVGTDPALLPKHKVFMSVGHDEYWTAGQRKNVTDARDSGVNLAFMGGNDVYWKSRWEPSQDGNNTANRTLVTYKDTWADTQLDPKEPTPTWRDPRFGQLDYGYGPENALIGTQFQANSVDLAIQVSAAEGRLRLWRGTTLAAMASGTTATLSDHTVGYESNEDVDNGYRPAGLIDMSTTVGPTPEYLTDYGNTVVSGTTTHHVTLYRAASGALVFSAGSIQWGWGLDSNHDGTATPADPRMRQATANLLADMGTTPTTVAGDLVQPTASTDTTPPTVSISAPAAGSTIAQGSLVTVSGTASDVGGVVAGVEVSVDGGATFHPASGTTSWTYSDILTGNGPGAIQVRATDDSARTQVPAKLAVNSACPCSIFGVAVPRLVDAADGSDVTLGTKFTASADGFISGLRFYKAAANTGPHTGTLYAANGTVLATGTFKNETASGWQTMTFNSSVAITAGTTYVAAYRAPNGHYSADLTYFAVPHNAGVLTASGGTGVANGVYAEGANFPSSSYRQTNYYVDPLYSDVNASPVLVTAVKPSAGGTSVPVTSNPKVTFSKDVPASSLTMQITDPSGTAVPATVSYDAATFTATANPSQGLASGTLYTVTVNAANLAAPVQWTFTTAVPDGQPNVCPCTLFNDDEAPASGPDADTRPVQLGMAFTVGNPGQITGIRFYKNLENQGDHTVALWSGSTKLAEANVTSETTSGWQQASFDTPVPVETGTTYVASYLAPLGRYAFTGGGLASKLTKAPLSSVANGGRYGFTTSAPTSTSSANYFVDPVFAPAPAAAPVVRQISPADGAASVRVGTQVSVTFSTDIQPGSAQISLKRVSDGVAIDGTTSGESQGSVANFVPAGDLDPGTKYTVTVSGARNLAGTPMTSTTTATFTTSGAAACPCTLFDSTIKPGQSDSGDTAAVTLGVTFTPTVNGYIKGLRYYRDAANTGTHTGTLYTAAGERLADLTFTDSGTGWQTANFATTVPVTAGTTYVAAYYAPNGRYSVDLNYFGSDVSNPPLRSASPGGVYLYANGFPNKSYMRSNYYVDVVFTTNDTDPPVVSSVAPTAGATSVPASTAVTATFARPIDPTTLDFRVTDPNGQLVGGQLLYDASSRTATFTTSSSLLAGATYMASVTASSSSGVAMVASKTWSFTTEDTQPPTVAAVGPGEDAAGVSPTARVSAAFTNPIDPTSPLFTVTNAATSTSVSGTTSYDATTRTATFTPSAALANYTSYTASVSARNTSGISMPTPKTWSFTTADTIAPTVSSTAPAAGATGVAGASVVSATFARTVDPASVQLTLKNAAGTSVSGSTSYNAATRTATFTPGAALGSATTYTATVTAKNPSGVAMATAKTWSFTVADTDAPVVSGRAPAAGATNVAPTSTVTATFARSVASSPSPSLSLKTAAGSSVTGTTTYNTATRTITFTPSAALTSSTGYTATVNATSAGGTPMAPATWSFATAAQTFSLYATTRTPSATVTTTTPTTVGVSFSSSRAGSLTGIRYYAASTNTARTVKLYSSTGTVLGTATTTATGTGWRTANFATPVAITAGTTYVASYYSSVGRWSTTTGGYSSAYTSGPLSVAVSGGRTGNGDTYPATTNTTNFWVDVLVLI